MRFLRTIFVLILTLTFFDGVEARTFRVLFDSSESGWSNVRLSYQLYNEDESYVDTELKTLQLNALGTKYWVGEFESGVYPTTFTFDNSAGSALTAVLSGVEDWSGYVCFKYSTRPNGQAYVERPELKVLTLNFKDKYGWGASLVQGYYAETGSLFDNWIKRFAEVPDVIISEGLTIDGATLYSMTVVADAEKTPCLWIRDPENPSNSIVSAAHNGMVLSHTGELCERSVYAAYKGSESLDWDFYGFAVPYKSGSYEIEWILRSKKGFSNLFSEIAYTTKVGDVDNFVAGAIRPVISSSDSYTAENIETLDTYHKLTEDFDESVSAYCRVKANAGADPTIHYVLPSKDAELRVKASLRFDSDGSDEGDLYFTAVPVKALHCKIVSVAGSTSTESNLEISLTSDGKAVAQYIGGVKLISDDDRVIAELTRALGARTRSELIISDEDVLSQLKTNGYISIPLGLLRPDLHYIVSAELVPGNGVSDAEWQAFNFGSSEENDYSNKVFVQELVEPKIHVGELDYEFVDLTDSQTTGLEGPVGLQESVYSQGVRVKRTLIYDTMTMLPDGWKTLYRLEGIDGSILGESEDNHMLISGLAPECNRSFFLRGVYVSPEGEETCTESQWIGSEVFPDMTPQISNVSAGQSIVFWRESGEAAPYGNVYDLVIECNHEISNPYKLPVYLGISVENEAADSHAGHLVDGHEAEINFLLENESIIGRETTDAIYGNAGFKADNKHQWARLIANNDRVAIYIQHFACDKPGEKTSVYGIRKAPDHEAGVKTTLHAYVPVLVSDYPRVEGSVQTLADPEERVLIMSPEVQDGHTVEHVMSLNNLGDIATGFSAQIIEEEQFDQKLFDVLGRVVNGTPSRGIYFSKGKKVLIH